MYNKLAILATLPLLLFSLFSYRPEYARAIDPFPPFSAEGNPEEDYYFQELFPLFRYIKPPFLKVYENRDRSRNYEDVEVCRNGDRRDKVCDNVGDGCDGGEVDICYKGVRAGQIAYVAHSNNGSCSVNQNDPPGTVGTCSYTQRPTLSGELQTTDFSAENKIQTLNPPPASTLNPSSNLSGLTYPKLQNEALRYSNYGNANDISWGAHYLGLTQCERAIKQAMVVERAKQTKNTVSVTGEWPLGWVDWGYTTQNGRTLLEISDSLPGTVAGPTKVIIEATDDMFLNAGNLAAVSPSFNERKIVCEEFEKALNKTVPDKWATDLSQVPIYSPSFRQGYARGSICVWDLCCPGLYCPFSGGIGNPNALYADISVSQAFGAAMDDIFLNYNLEEGIKVLKDLAASNQLIRFAGSASPNAIPSAIHRRLSAEISDPCFQYVPEPQRFSFGWFGFHMDYVKPGAFLDPNKQCPDWRIQPELTKEKGGAYPQSVISKLLSVLWGNRVDQVSVIKRHLITIPDAMGQSLSETEDPVFIIRDTIYNNEIQNPYNLTLSNNVNATTDLYYSGKGIAVGDSKRRLAYFACSESDFSSPLSTGIEAYALGTRIGCFDEQAISGTCDPTLFATLLENNGGVSTTASSQASSYFDSYIAPNITPELLNIYGAASEKTGVPCEVLAGIHFIEGNNGSTASLVSGRQLGTPEPDAGGKIFRTLLETAIYAGDHLKGKVGGSIGGVPELITALSRYNGGGNSNCQLGYPYPIPYGGCPRAFEGEDDPYPTNYLDAKHGTMYLLYCADHTACAPQVFQRPGSYTVALEVYHKITKNGVTPSSANAGTTPPQPSPTTTAAGSNVRSVNPEGGCGQGFIDTGLGCLPTERDAFVASLLGLIAGVSGLIAIVTMLIATFMIMSAGGKPEQLQKGKQLFTAAIIGLFFVIFSVTILRIIAGDIIKIPGF